MEQILKITKEVLIKDIKKAGIQEGDILNLKISLKSIGWVEGGARTVINAFLEVVGQEGTIVTDSFVPVKSLKYLKKHDFLTDDKTPSYAGAVANAMLYHPHVRRSKHPIQKFAIIGKLADDFANNHTDKSYAYDVLRRMALMGGKKVRIGHPDKVLGMGTTHVAIGLLGYQQKRLSYGVHYLKGNKKEIFLVNWAGGCEEGFNKLFANYKKTGAFLYEGKVGQADIIVSDMKKTLDWEVSEGQKNPQFFFCDNPACIDCRLTWKFSSGSLIRVIMENIKIKKFGHALYAWLIYFKGIYRPDKS